VTKPRHSTKGLSLSPAPPANGGLTEKTPEPASPGAGKTPHSGTPGRSRANGRRNKPSQKAAARSKVNGHGPAAMATGLAASDDAGGNSVDPAATPAAPVADREAYAEAAAARRSGKGPSDSDSFVPGPGDNVAEMQDAAAFVHAVSAHEHLVGVFLGLLRSEDEKIKQRAVERALEMKFGKGSAPPEEPLRIEVDVPRPDRE
jgi:hypothetical protein